MHDAFRYGEALVRQEFDDPPFLKVDQQAAVNDIEELVLTIMLVPMELAFDDTEPYDAVIDLAQGLVRPALGQFAANLLDVDQLEETVFDTQIDGVGMLGQRHSCCVSMLRPEAPARASHRSLGII